MDVKTNEELINEYYKLAEEKCTQKKFSSAKSYYDMIFQLDSNRWDALFLKAKMEYYILNASISAVEWATTALLADTTLSRYFDAEGFTLTHIKKRLNSFACNKISNKQFSSALEDLNHALHFDPTYDMALLTMAECYVAMGDYQEALDWLEKAITLCPDLSKEVNGYDCYAPLRPFVRYQKLTGNNIVVSEEAKNALQEGIRLLKEEKVLAAKQSIEEALKLAPDWAEALLHRGLLTFETAEPSNYAKNQMMESGALQDLTRALDLDLDLIQSPYVNPILPTMAAALNDWTCDEYIPKRRFYEAIHDLKLALKLQPDYIWAMLTMAEVEVQIDNNDGAIHWLEKAVEIDPSIWKDIDIYECYAPLRSDSRYQRLVGIEAGSEQSFYKLDMFVEPGGMREYLQLFSSDTGKLRHAITARLMGPMGLYALLSYGMTIQVHCYCEGIRQNTVNLLPFIKVTLSKYSGNQGSLTAYFNMDNTLTLQNCEKEAINKEKLAGFLSEYIYNPASDTLTIGDWESEIDNLWGEQIKSGQTFPWNGNEITADIVYELESGEDYSLENFILMMNSEE